MTAQLDADIKPSKPTKKTRTAKPRAKGGNKTKAAGSKSRRAAIASPRVLVGNIFFSPTSFGGATVVAENMATELRNRLGFDTLVVTSTDCPQLMNYRKRRFVSKGLDIIGVKIPPIPFDDASNWDNPEFNASFGEVLDAVKPDVVHLHSVQMMGVTAFHECKKRSIPLVVTVHDCWFICERQFMINHAGRYCHQEVIDLNICRYCVSDINKTRRRNEAIHAAIDSVDLFLFPSEFHRMHHVRNGFPSEKCAVNNNGVLEPKRGFKRKPIADPNKHRLRFGFFGGPGPIKGASVMARAFKQIKRKDYEVRVVDAAGNVGQTWVHDPVWKDIPGTVTFIPPYKQDTMDEVFAEIDVLLFPSQWKESFGLTVREAIKRDIWVVTTDAGGVVEQCIEGKNANILPLVGDHRKLASVLEDLLDNPPPSKIAKSHIINIKQQADELAGHLKMLID